MNTPDPWGDSGTSSAGPSSKPPNDDWPDASRAATQRRQKNRWIRWGVLVGVPLVVIIGLSEVFNRVQQAAPDQRVLEPPAAAPQAQPPALLTMTSDGERNSEPDPRPPSSGPAEASRADRPADLQAFIDSGLASVVLVECAVSEQEAAHGSGFVLDTRALDGKNALVIITNWHVVKTCLDPDAIFLTTADGPVIEASVGVVDADADLVTLEAPNLGLAPLQVGSSPLQGDWVMAMGNPQGVSGTITVGVVSSIKPGEIFSDASIAPGSSGGALVNNRGEVIGVTSWLFEESSNFSISRDIRSLCDTILQC